MKSKYKTLWVGLAVLVLLSTLPCLSHTQQQVHAAPESALLSPYWAHAIQQWDRLIVQEANRRAVAPDLLASLVWKESRGDAGSIGPKGAVGLMQIMPQEAGFSWRPPKDELLDPEINLFWGTRTLSIVIHQGQGDVLNALAAYNGGWERITLSGPRQYATTILRNYVTSVAQRLAVSGRWIAYFGIQQGAARGPIWVADADRADMYFYGHTNRLPDGSLLIPHRAPTAIVAHCVDEESGAVYDVALWLYAVADQRWVDAVAPRSATPEPPATLSPTPTPTPTPTVLPSLTPTTLAIADELTTTVESTLTPPPTPKVTQTGRPTPTSSPTTTPTPQPTASSVVDAIAGADGTELRPGPTLWWDVADVLPTGTELRVLGYDAAVADWIYVSTLAGRDGWALLATLDVLVDLDDVPLVTPRPTLTPSLTPSPSPTLPPTATPKPKIACNGEPFFAEAWPMNKFNTDDGGWTAVVVARGYEGTCNYTYAWDDPENVVGGPTYEPVIFEVSSPRRDAPIVGSVIVDDGETSISVGMYIKSPNSGE